MLDQGSFFEKFRITKKAFADTKLDWAELQAISDDHIGRSSELLDTGNLISGHLRRIDEVHSLKIRVKDPEHLVEKVIRKKQENPSRTINFDNYRTEIIDLIGVRALHLFKDDWVGVHKKVISIWEPYKPPVANIRKGDPETVYKENGCEINDHKAGYRSVHYLIKTQPTKDVILAEIQVRTIFEEGWSEIDHRLRYPYDVDNVILAEYLAIFNRLAGSADEMGTFIKRLKAELEIREQVYRQELEASEKEKAKIIKDLEALKKKLKAEGDDKKRLQEIIDSLSKYQTPAVKLLPSNSGGLLGSDILNSKPLDPLSGLTITAKPINYSNPINILESSKLSATGLLTSTRICSFCGKHFQVSSGLVVPTCPYCHRNSLS